MEQRQVNRGELLVIGIGGMGIVTLGDIIAKTALRRYKHVAWFPCYAAMMRGGESECCVTFSSEEISSPLIYRSEVLMVMGVRRVEVFEDRVRPGGLMLLEASGINEEYQPSRKDIRMGYIPALEEAKQLGEMRNANLVMLGAYIEITKALPSDLVLKEIENRFGGKGREARAVAAKGAFIKGMSLAAK